VPQRPRFRLRLSIATLLDKLVGLAKQKNVFAQRIRTILPAHFSFVGGIKSNNRAKINDIFARYPGSLVPRTPVYSTCRADQFVDAFKSTPGTKSIPNSFNLYSVVIYHEVGLLEPQTGT
jgi:hypothetical protein